MTPGGGGSPGGKLNDAIARSFGSMQEFVKRFTDAAVSQFGSGYAWLVVEKGSLIVMKTSNADNPIAHNLKPLLAIDLWEHAYYLDYQNRREDYVTAFLKSLVNWRFAEECFER
jgi:Fe-Mn family superoxide dismutase